MTEDLKKQIVEKTVADVKNQINQYLDEVLLNRKYTSHKEYEAARNAVIKLLDYIK